MSSKEGLPYPGDPTTALPTVHATPESPIDISTKSHDAMPYEEIDEVALYHLVPDLHRYLTPSEQLRRVVPDAMRISHQRMSSEYALRKLAGVGEGEDIGDHPLNAATSVDGHENSLEFNRYVALFGRDSLFTAITLIDEYPRLAQTTIHAHAQRQGTEENNIREEEVGKIIHEDRTDDDPIGKLLKETQGWEFPYYGSVDSTLWYTKLLLLHSAKEGNTELLQQTYIGKDGKKHTYEYSLRQALGWQIRQMDKNPQGFVEFCRKNPNGLQVQSWQDSWDSHHHANGKVADPGNSIASIEVQSLAYDDLLNAADLYQTSDSAYAAQLRGRAQQLKESVMSTYWIEDERGAYFAMGSERDRVTGEVLPFKIRKSNMGWLLNSRLLDGNEPAIVEKREHLIQTLFSSEMLNCAGIRTLSNREVRFKPTAYHNGSVWSWDSYWIAQGLERHGYYGLAWVLYDKIQSVIDASGEYPEFSRGSDSEYPEFNNRVVVVFNADDGCENCIEQPAQEIQGFTAAPARVIERKVQQKRDGVFPYRADHPYLAAFEEGILVSL